MAWLKDRERHSLVGHGAKSNSVMTLPKFEAPEVTGQFVIPTNDAFRAAGKKKMPNSVSYVDNIIEAIKEYFKANPDMSSLELNLKVRLSEGDMEILKRAFPNIKFYADGKKLKIVRESSQNTDAKILSKNEMQSMIEIILQRGGVKIKPNIKLTKEQYEQLDKLFMHNIYAYKDADGSIILLLRDSSNREIDQSVYDEIFGKKRKSYKKEPELTAKKPSETKPKAMNKSEVKSKSKPKPKRQKPSKPKRYRREKPNRPEDIFEYLIDGIMEFLFGAGRKLKEVSMEIEDTITPEKVELPKPKLPEIKATTTKKPSKPKKPKPRTSKKPSIPEASVKIRGKQVKFNAIDIEDVIKNKLRVNSKSAPIYGFITPIGFAGRVTHPTHRQAEVDSYYFDKYTALIMQAFGWNIMDMDKKNNRIRIKMMPSDKVSDNLGYYGGHRRMLFYIKKLPLKKPMHGYDSKGNVVKINPGNYKVKVINKDLLLISENSDWSDTDKIYVIPKSLVKSSLMFKERY